MALEVMGSTPTTHPIEKALAYARAFSVKFVPAERVKYAGACEIACGCEIHLRHVGEQILFHIATKECSETEYWLELFVKSELLDREIAKDLYNAVQSAEC